MEFGPLQCTGKVGDKVRDKVQDKFPTKSRTCRGHKSWKSATWFVSRTLMICVRDFVANLSQTLSQSRRNGIRALPYFLSALLTGLTHASIIFMCDLCWSCKWCLLLKLYFINFIGCYLLGLADSGFLWIVDMYSTTSVCELVIYLQQIIIVLLNSCSSQETRVLFTRVVASCSSSQSVVPQKLPYYYNHWHVRFSIVYNCWC